LRLRAPQGCAQLFRGLRSVRRLRADLWRLEARPQGGRDPHSLREPHLRRNADLAFPAWLHAAAHGAVRVHAHQGDVMKRPAPDQLADYRCIWECKPVLRLVYEDFYDRIAATCSVGRTIEIGSGVGNLKQRLSDVIATDIQFAPWLDCAADAQRLPFADACAANIVMVDVLHHLQFPLAFFREPARVWRPDGRVLMVEPAITWGSSLFYRLFHHEPVRTSADVLGDGVPDPARDPYESNQAIPTLLATRDRERF